MLAALVLEAAPAVGQAGGQSAAGAPCRHETGLGLRPPAGWTVKDNLQAVILLAPGVRFDPNRQENTELYMALVQDDYDSASKRESVEELSAAFLQSDTPVVRSGERETLAGAGGQHAAGAAVAAKAARQGDRAVVQRRRRGWGARPAAGASAIRRESMTGRWKIRDNNGEIFLQIWTNDGQMLLLPITTDDRNWYLTGEKAFAVDP
jgi:hypothetical protein